MARIVKEHSVRKNEILDEAQRLIYTKGYEQMTIQDILDALQISKGAFYYYFDSKQALLEASIERMIEAITKVIEPIVEDENLTSIEKFNLFIATTANWKTERKDYLLPIMRVWYADENAIVRQKLQARGYALIAPILSGIILEGVQEGVMHTTYPDQVGVVVYSLMYSVGEKIAGIILSSKPADDDWPYLKKITAVYTDAIEKTIGVSSGILHIFDIETLKEWVVPVAATQA